MTTDPTKFMANLAASFGKSEDQVSTEVAAYQPAFRYKGPVRRNADFTRIDALPRRKWEEQVTPDKVEKISAFFRQEKGTQTLFPIQAAALWELHKVGGLFGGIGTGKGKTITSLLAPIVLEKKNPLLILPAALIEKTKREMAAIGKHWRTVNWMPMRSYEVLGRAEHSDVLWQIAPDMIIMDEAHKAKNTSAAITKRLDRYIKEFDPVVVALSGTMTRNSILEYAHILRWTLKDKAPIPWNWEDRLIWAQALDYTKEEDSGDYERDVSPGVLLEWTPPESQHLDVLTQARHGWRDRLSQTPGVIMSGEEDLKQSLIISSEIVTPSSTLWMEGIRQLRVEERRPDGELLLDDAEKWRHLMEMAAGFFYRWNPMPPEWWLLPRRAWSKMERDILKHNRRGLDSAKQLADEIERGGYNKYPHVVETYQRWREVEKKFVPTTEAVWVSEHMVGFCIDWMKKVKGIVWVSHIEFGERLSGVSGVPYYGERGLDKNGRFIEDHPKGQPVIASIMANKEGRNLQYKWSDNLIPVPPSSGGTMEQLLARTHRYGQTAEEVTCLLPIVIREQVTAFWRAKGEAAFMKDSTGADQKLLNCDVLVMSPDEAPSGLADPTLGHKRSKTRSKK